MIEYTTTAGEAITDALFLCEAQEEGEPPNADAIPGALRALNRLLKHLQAVAGHQWLMTEGVLFCEPGKAKFTLGKDTVIDRAAQGDIGADWGGFVLTEQSPTVPTSLVDVDDASLIEAGYMVGFLTAGSASYQWHTVASKSGNQLSLTAVIGDTGLEGTQGYWVRTLAQRPSVVLSARRGVYNGAEIPMDVVGREVYMEQPNKTSHSVPVMVHYSPQRDTGDFYLWPIGGYGTVVRYTYERAIEVVSSTADALDLPDEWYDALVYNLADRLAPQYALNPTKRQLLKMEASAHLNSLLSFDQEGDGFVVSVGL